MRGLIAVALVALLGSSAVAARNPDLPENAAWTYLLFGYMVADYYVTHRTWPTTRKQVEAHSERVAQKELPPKGRDMRRLWRRCTQLELTPQGPNVLVRMRFRSEGREFTYDALYHPGRSAEDIFEHITPK
jgi:hypothetical protein